ncbi:hypothetical protein MUK42_36913 [Musa troglodytarum]|uniref:Uncharacterized protein n=1 Tax=Musa troglodytarum TaxID=320322 RepID=A0A9E7FL13_9LILI|nr:hypothetical protein MUK42_36913 [Musa troglodytarum]
MPGGIVRFHDGWRHHVADTCPASWTSLTSANAPHDNRHGGDRAAGQRERERGERDGGEHADHRRVSTPVFVPLVTAASSSVSLSLCCRPSASLRSPSGSPFEPSKPRLPIIVACTAAPFNEFEAKVRAQKQLCKVSS